MEETIPNKLTDDQLSYREQLLAQRIYDAVAQLNHTLKNGKEFGVTGRFVAVKANGVDVGMAGDVDGFKVYVGGNSNEFWRTIADE